MSPDASLAGLHCRRERTLTVSTRDAQRLGPIRSKEKLTAAFRELDHLDRVLVRHEARQENIEVNPRLLEA